MDPDDHRFSRGEEVQSYRAVTFIRFCGWHAKPLGPRRIQMVTRTLGTAYGGQKTGIKVFSFHNAAHQLNPTGDRKKICRD